MATQVSFNTLSQVNGGQNGTAATLYSGSTDQLLSAVITAGAVADAVAAERLKVGDILFVRYDVDGTPGFALLQVSSTSDGSLVYVPTYPQGVTHGVLPTWGGGSASNAFTLSGVLSTDDIVAVIKASANAVSICKVVPTTNTVTITFSGDPGAGTIVTYIRMPA